VAPATPHQIGHDAKTRASIEARSEQEEHVRTYRSRSVVKTVAALASASLLLAACGGGDDGGGGGEAGGGGGGGGATDIGVTESSIKLGTHMPLTGVASPGYSEIPTGTRPTSTTSTRRAASTAGPSSTRSATTPTTRRPPSQVTNQLVLQDEIFGMIGGLGTPTHSAVIDFLNEEEVPDLFVSSGSLNWDNPEEYPYTFGWQPNYAVEGKVIGQYIAEEFPDAKVGLFLQGDDFGRDGAAGVKQFIEDQIVAEETYTPGNTDVGPQIAALQAAGADFVLGFNVPSYTGAEPAHRAAPELQAEVVLLQRRLRHHARRLAAQPLLRGRGRRRRPAQRHLHDQVPPDGRGAGQPLDPAVHRGLGGARRRQADEQLPPLRHGAGLHLRLRAAGGGRGPHPRRHRRGARGAGLGVRGPVARAARLLRRQPPGHQRRLGQPDRGQRLQGARPVATTDGEEGEIEPFEDEPFEPTEDGLPAVE
jgi:hypothetical protein